MESNKFNSFILLMQNLKNRKIILVCLILNMTFLSCNNTEKASPPKIVETTSIAKIPEATETIAASEIPKATLPEKATIDLIQDRLNAQETPLAIVKSGVDVQQLYGKNYKGGLIFYFNPKDGTGIVAATEDTKAGAIWGCFKTRIRGADRMKIGAGIQNTKDILSGCPELVFAAKLCDNLVLNGMTDWFLPSKDELNLMWINLADSDGNEENKGADDLGNLGGFAAATYWSSSENGSILAWNQDFDQGGIQYFQNKNDTHLVRAARAF